MAIRWERLGLRWWGTRRSVAEEEKAAVKEIYLARHANASYWVDFADFHFFRLEPVDMYYVGGFGVMGWVEAGDFAGAKADPLAEAAAGIMAHMNADHVASMVTLAKAYAGIEGSEAAMTSVDRLGFTLRVKTAEGMKGPRINFLSEVHRCAGDAQDAGGDGEVGEGEGVGLSFRMKMLGVAVGLRDGCGGRGRRLRRRWGWRRRWMRTITICTR